MKMVTSAKILEVNGDRGVFHKLMNDYQFNRDTWNIEADMPDIKVAQEAIRGEWFRNEQGKDVCIGWSADVQDALGLPFKAFESMNKTMSYMNKDMSELRSRNTLLEEILKVRGVPVSLPEEGEVMEYMVIVTVDKKIKDGTYDRKVIWGPEVVISNDTTKMKQKAIVEADVKAKDVDKVEVRYVPFRA